MCGRYQLDQTGEDLAQELSAAWRGALMERPRYNIAPTQHAPVLLEVDGRRVLEMYRWGLIPFWAKDPSIGNKMINARAETVFEKPAYRSAIKRQRCLVPVRGFYEWQKTRDGKVPHWIHSVDGSVLTFAGLWERWTPEGAEPVFSFAILTTGPSAFMQRIHDRMPVIIAPEDRDGWLDPATEQPELAGMMRPYREDGLAAHAVSTRVNIPRNDGPELIEAAA